MRVHHEPEIYATIQELSLEKGGEIEFSPLNFILNEMEFHIYIEFMGSKAQLAAEFGLNSADKMVSKALDSAAVKHVGSAAKEVGSAAKGIASAAGSAAKAAEHSKVAIVAGSAVKEVGKKLKEDEQAAVHKATHIEDELGKKLKEAPHGAAAHDTVSKAVPAKGAIAGAKKPEDSAAKDHKADDEKSHQTINAFTMQLVVDMKKDSHMEHVVVKIHDLKTSIQMLEQGLKRHRLRDQIELHMSEKATKVIAKKLHEQVNSGTTLSFEQETAVPSDPVTPKPSPT